MTSVPQTTTESSSIAESSPTAVSPDPVRQWAARAIFLPDAANPIDLLPDRQSYGGPEEGRDPFFTWINHRALPLLRQKLKDQGLRRDSSEVIRVTEWKYSITASPKSSHGYLYIEAEERPVIEVSRVDGQTRLQTLKREKGDPVLWSSMLPVPAVGDELALRTFWGFQKSRVVGYGVEGGYLFALCRMETPPKAWLKQMLAYRVGLIRKKIAETHQRYMGAEAARRQTETDVKRELFKRGLSPESKGLKVMAETEVYWAAGVDLKQAMTTPTN